MDDEIRRLLEAQETQGERRANYMRLLISTLFLLIFIGFYVKSERHYLAGYVILADISSLLLYAIIIHVLVSRGHYHSSIKYASYAADTICITVMALSSLFLSSGLELQGWITNIAVFLLFIALSGLRFSPGLCLFTGILTSAEFVVLNLFVTTAGGKALPPPQLATIAVLLMASGGVVALTARSARQLIVQAAGAERQRAALVYEAEYARRLAVTDELTGLHNRRYFMSELKREVTRSSRYVRPFAILTIDLDNFKTINDTFGHLAGDLVLRQVGVILRNKSRETDVVARYGGDEFGLILFESTREQAELAAERLRHAVKVHEFEVDSGIPDLQVSLSIGLACFPSDGTDEESLLRSADGALYRAKALGRDRVVFAGS